MNNPLISILVPTYNRQNFLQLALYSLINQSYKNIEIICINDAGSDVQDIINNINDDRIKYYSNKRNIDLAATRNKALTYATGEYITLLDDDDILLPYALEFRMNMMKKLNVDVVYTRALKNIMERVKIDDNSEVYRTVHQSLYWDSPFNRDLILVQNIAPCNCVTFSRKSWDASNCTFDTSLTTSEDWNAWVHLSRKYNFMELGLIDCECSYRTDNTQMTGSRQGYTDHLPHLYKKWREYSDNKDWVISHQNAALRARGLSPEDYGL